MCRHLAVVISIGALLAVMSSTASAAPNSLVALGAAKFPKLTHAERAMLEFAQAGNIERPQFAVAGTSANPIDPSNDPKSANEWDKSREIRASLIRWLCEDPDATHLVGPSGIAVIGARIVGDLNLDAVHPGFGLTLVHCSIPGRISMINAHLQSLAMSDSYSGQIYAVGLVTDFGVLLDGVQSSGELDLDSANIGGFLALRRSHFRHGSHPLPYMEALASWNLAVRVVYAQIHGAVDMIQGFEADGAVEIDNSTISGDFTVFGSRFTNPDNVAFAANSDVVGGDVMLSWTIGSKMAAYFLGQAEFYDDQIAGGFYSQQVVFDGAPNTHHGLLLFDTSIKGLTLLPGIRLVNGATLDLTGSSTHLYVDDQAGWPAPGKLTIDGLTYDGVTDADSRLPWLRLQNGFHRQPYRELANYLRRTGDESGAVKVLVAEEDARYGEMDLPARLFGKLFKWTVGYGHRPLIAILWSLAIVLLGWIAVAVAKRAGVMRQTWPENTPPPPESPEEPLHPFLYSLDTFLPFVNLHQEHYWWPDAAASGECEILGRKLRVSGAFLRYYLWMQVIAGWLLSAIFVAGVTGLMRGD